MKLTDAQIQGLVAENKRLIGRLQEMQAKLDETLAIAEQAISFGTVRVEPQTVPLFHLAIKNEVTRALTNAIQKEGSITEQNMHTVGTRIIYRFYRTLGRFQVLINDAAGQ